MPYFIQSTANNVYDDSPAGMKAILLDWCHLCHLLIKKT